MLKNAVLIAGPTASGKSRRAMEIAGETGGIVVNADSMQVYRDLRVLTARPSYADEARIPHRLFGMLDAGDICSAARWRDMACAAIDEIHAAGRRAIVTGGTGLYLRALMTGLADVPPIPEAVREAARARHVDLGGAAFHAALAERDPVMASRLAPGDSQRCIRAWEVVTATGRSLADWQTEGHAASVPYTFDVVLLLPPREALYAACDDRLGAMFEREGPEEVRALDFRVANGELAADVPLLKALGVPEIRAWLQGTLDRDSALADARQATRRFAKRQMTWFRHQLADDAAPSIRQIMRVEEKYSVDILDEIFAKIS